MAVLALVVAGCSPYAQYGASQSHKYQGLALFNMYEEWSTPVVRTRLPGGGRFYQFQKPGTECRASVWANDLDIVVRFAVSGPESCAAVP